MSKRGRWWVRQRETFRHFAEWAMRPSSPTKFLASFHVQQAAEKLLKAWLAAQSETYPLSHDLAALLDMLSAVGADVACFDELVDYTRYAVRLRYAGTDPGVGPLNRSAAIKQVEALLAAVQCWLAETEAG